MSKGGIDVGTLLTLGAVGVGGYFVYTNYFANALPADAEFIAPLPAGATIAVPQSMASMNPGAYVTGPAITQAAYLYYSPSQKLLYTSYTAPTAAQQANQVPLNQLGQSAPSATGSTVTTSPAPISTPSVPAGSGPPPPPVPSSPSLATIWANAQAAAAPDANLIRNGGSMTPYQWNYYISYVQPSAPTAFSGVWPPDPGPVFPGVDLTQPMSAATYWASMQKAMAAGGLSGLLAGMGCFDCGYGMGDAASDAVTAGDIAAFNASGASVLLDPNAGGNFTGGVPISAPSPGAQGNLTSANIPGSMNWMVVGAAALAIFAVMALPGAHSDSRGRY